MSAPVPAVQPGTRPLSISPAARSVLFSISLALMLTITATLQLLNRPLQNGIAAQGVVSLVLAHTLERQSEIFASWNESDLVQLAFSVGLDFLNGLVFVGTMIQACMWLVGNSGSPAAFRAKFGRAVIYALASLGVVWTLQGVLLTRVVFGQRTALTAEVIYWCALWKFTVMGVSTAYAAAGAATLGLTHFSRR